MVELGTLDELEPGVVKSVVVGRRSIALVRWGEEVFAVRNMCPHESQPFDGGQVVALVRSERALGDVSVAHDEPVVTCPVHNFSYRLRDGRCLATPLLRVRSYDVEVREGRIYVDIGQRRVRSEQ